MAYLPEAGDTFDLHGRRYVFPPAYPGASHPHEAEGGRATVIKAQDLADGSFWALKVFKPRYRVPAQAARVEVLATIQHLPGLHAARQRAVTPDLPLAAEQPELRWAVLMPWIEGDTWNQILGKAQRSDRLFSQEEALVLALRLLAVASRLEREGITHCDLAGGNVIVRTDEEGGFEIQLVDLDDMLIRDQMPASFTPGSLGYTLPGVTRTACPEGDRYAAAILTAEALSLALPYARDLVTSEGVLRGDRNDRGARVRFEQIVFDLCEDQPEFAAVLRRAWTARSLSECVSIADLAASLDRAPVTLEIENEVDAFVKARLYLAEVQDRVTGAVSRVAREVTGRVGGRLPQPFRAAGVRGWMQMMRRTADAPPEEPMDQSVNPADFVASGGTAGSKSRRPAEPDNDRAEYEQGFGDE